MAKSQSYETEIKFVHYSTHRIKKMTKADNDRFSLVSNLN